MEKIQAMEVLLGSVQHQIASVEVFLVLGVSSLDGVFLVVVVVVVMVAGPEEAVMVVVYLEWVCLVVGTVAGPKEAVTVVVFL